MHWHGNGSTGRGHPPGSHLRNHTCSRERERERERERVGETPSGGMSLKLYRDASEEEAFRAGASFQEEEESHPQASARMDLEKIHTIEKTGSKSDILTSTHHILRFTFEPTHVVSLHCIFVLTSSVVCLSHRRLVGRDDNTHLMKGHSYVL